MKSMTEKEARIFQDFIEKSSEIKESWEIARLFEAEREKFRQDIAIYEREINQAKATLRDIRLKTLDLKDEIEKLNAKKEETITQINEINQDLFRHKIKKNISNLKHEKYQIVHEKKEEILPKPIESVDIYLKDGSIAKARPVKKIFSDMLYKKYRIILRENRSLKEQILEFELENSKLKIEVRDFYTEDILRENEKSSGTHNTDMMKSQALGLKVFEEKELFENSKVELKKDVLLDSKILDSQDLKTNLDDLMQTEQTSNDLFYQDETNSQNLKRKN